MSKMKSLLAAARWLVLSGTVAVVLLFGLKQPLHDWDVIGYVASAYQFDGYSGADLLDRTFRDVRSSVDEGTFRILTEGEDPNNRDVRYYRETVSSDPKALSEQIPFYSIRPVYINLILLIGRTGYIYSKSAYILSAACSALGVIALNKILSAANVHFAALPFIVVAVGLADLARRPSPDSLATLFSFLCILAILKDNAMSFVFSATLPLMRTDFIIVSILVLLFEFIRGKRAASIMAMSLSIVFYILVNRISGNYGWLTLFNFSEIYTTPYPAEMAPSLNWKAYARSYVSAAYNLIYNGQFILYYIATYFLYFRFRNRSIPRTIDVPRWIVEIGRLDARMAALYVIPLLYAVCHILLFPHYEPRHFVFSAALIFVWILSREEAPEPARAVIAETAGVGGPTGPSAAILDPRPPARD